MPELVNLPKTVGDFIELLQKYPANYSLDMFRRVFDYGGGAYDETVYMLKIHQLAGMKSLEITCH